MERLFELFLLFFGELSLSSRSMSIGGNLLKRLDIESLEPIIDRFALNAVPLGKFSLRNGVFVGNRG
ncbi:hypothetical protein Htur_4642 (plasmid) [Haloterrigena turkmenica DSM 5511]|uniref:Uncharacterized protein n=1 Tax=Haloterrigena turkmenica (strain ATCC 51198 / DSM 5511 / JCM 9101 / NCIMB 13204 / VKM B-1734 / 4k) TaxID=543526 RepID=D2S231_HALTV|nr:hypothetical protein Htur_4642 [Haloterrigena turkmenica DSM 5511]